jgi:hypothetical protein
MSVEIKKQFSNDNPWLWDGCELKKQFSNDNPWIADGDVPIPVWAVILGIVR